MATIASTQPVLDVDGSPLVGAVVRAYRRDTGAFLVAGVTDAMGEYSLETVYADLCDVVCLYPTLEYADKIIRTTPV